jgi:hypothetical protein
MDEGLKGCLLVGSRGYLDAALHSELEISFEIAQGNRLVFVEA